MWKQVKYISLNHPVPEVRAYGKHLLAKMNSGKKWEARNEIQFFIERHYSSTKIAEHERTRLHAGVPNE
jgi:hypothetical protein